MDAKALCKKDKQGRYVICANELYPAAIKHVQAQLKKEMREIPQHLRQLYSEAKRVPAKGFINTLRERATPTTRRAALEVARKWFTRLLKDQIGEPFVLRIVPGEERERWKL